MVGKGVTQDFGSRGGGVRNIREHRTLERMGEGQLRTLRGRAGVGSPTAL